MSDSANTSHGELGYIFIQAYCQNTKGDAKVLGMILAFGSTESFLHEYNSAPPFNGMKLTIDVNIRSLLKDDTWSCSHIRCFLRPNINVADEEIGVQMTNLQDHRSASDRLGNFQSVVKNCFDRENSFDFTALRS